MKNLKFNILFALPFLLLGLTSCGDDREDEDFLEVQSNDQIRGEFVGGDDCVGDYHLAIANSSFSKDIVVVSNIFGAAYTGGDSDIDVKANVNGNGFSIIPQTIIDHDGDTVQVEPATGSVTDRKLKLDFKLIYPSFGDTVLCTFEGTRLYKN